MFTEKCFTLDWLIVMACQYIELHGKSKVKLATLVEGDQKASFSIATTPGCRGGCYSFPWMAPLYPWYVPYIAECWAGRHQVPFLKSLVWCNLGLNAGLPDQWRTLYLLKQWAAAAKNDTWPGFWSWVLIFQDWLPNGIFFSSSAEIKVVAFETTHFGRQQNACQFNGR